MSACASFTHVKILKFRGGGILVILVILGGGCGRPLVTEVGYLAT